MNKNFNILLLVVFILMIIPNIFSLGITPGRTTIDYQLDLKKEIKYSLLNNENKDIRVLLSVQGELAEYITLYDSSLNFNNKEESKSLKYEINLPDSLKDIPGLHTAEIIAFEIPEKSSSGTFVGATIAVASQVYVYVPYPGKYIETGLDILGTEQNSTAVFIIPVINRGKLGIGEARAIIDIYNSNNQKIDSLETDYMPVSPGSRTELSAKWLVNVPPGSYLAKVSVFYDGETKNFEKQFNIGIEALSIESILVNNFRLGEIARIQVLVENKKNELIKDVFANLLVFNEESQVMADLKSPDEDIEELSKKQLILFWDTIGVEEGEYNGKLFVRYGEKSTDKNLVLKISEDSLDIFGVGYAINPKGGDGINITTILMAIIIILIIINASWFVLFRRLIKK